uniref:Transport and Golgi organization protein 1 homolog n=1 Tax=Podarcis muralis TaxID=64176 RepID=A0A670HWU6_PODMU
MPLGHKNGSLFTLPFFSHFLSTVLMCRGKAVKDFKGPDCRFVDFKEGESVYVYYKLTGRTHELWAGSVGNEFGYFPKDLLEINHIYTYEELELPTDETDFVCFNGGKDDFDNYNAEELLKLSEDMVASDAEAQLETEKEEETEGDEHTESVEETDGSEVGSEVGSEDHAKMGQKDNFIFENNENVEGALDSKSKDLTVNSNTDNPQGDQSAHQPSEEMLQETLKVPKYESAKNSSVSQGKAKQSDNGGEDDGTDIHLRQHEVLEDLKTTLGSTADVLVSDDETTSLVTPLDDDFSEDLGIDSYDTEKLEEPEEQSEEIPLLSFTEETKSSEDPEAEEMPSDGVFESETSDLDDGIAEAAGRFVHEKKDDSMVLISKKENTDVLADSKSSAEDDSITPENDLITKKIHNVDVGDPKGGKHETQDYEEEYSKAEVEPTIEELQSTSTHDFGAFSNYGGGRQPKASMGAKEKHLKPPLGDIKDDPEGFSLHKIIKGKETRDGHIEDSLENDTKHKTLWEKIGKKDGEGKQPMNIVPHLVEELTNESQPELGASDLLEGKTKQDGEDLELRKVLSNTKQSNDSAMESIPTEEDTEVPIVQSEQETVTQDLKKEEEEKNLIIEKPTQVTQHRNLTQQNTEELKPVELDAEEDDFLEVLEEELLQDENAASAKLSKERLADEQSFTSEAESGTTQLQMPNGAISRAANPVDAIGEDAITTLEQAKKEGMEDWNDAQEGIQINKDPQLSERKEIKEENQEEVAPQVKNSLLQEKAQYIRDKIMSNKINTSELENKNDFHEELQTLTEHQHSSDDFGPQDVSEKTHEAAEPEYSESVRQLNIMKEFLDEKRIARIQKYLGQQHIFRIESLFHDMELELMFAQKQTDNHADTEEALDRILESSESNILDVLNKVLDSREAENKEEVIKEIDLFDDEAALMDDIQELMYSLRQKYSPVSESAPLASLTESGMDSSQSITDMQPGPDFHGLPWEPIIITVFVGFATLAIFLWRTCLSVMTEKQLVEKIKTLLKEKTEILETMSEYDQKIKAAKEAVNEAQKQNTNLSDEATGLKDTIRGLKETNHLLDERVKKLHTMLETEKEHYSEKQKQLTEAQKSLENFQEVITLHSVELSEVQIALNEAKLSEEKVKSELSRIQEENTRLKKSKEQLLQQAEGWSERHSELSEQIKLYQKSQNDMEEALAYKENEIEVLTNCIMQLKQLDAESESEGKRDDGNDLANGELSGTKILDNLVDHSSKQIKKLEHDSCSLQRAKSQLESECKTLQQKVEILNELYQQKEMALQKKLSQEEYERQEKDQKLSAADEKAVLAVEDVKKYKKRIDEIVEELQQTERSYKNQIDIHEKKAHENWLIARSAERALAEEKRENSNLRLKLIEMDQKIAALQRPLIVKPTAGRPDHPAAPRRGPLSRDGSFGPSPVSGGAPSPPLMMEPLGRPLSANPREGSRGEYGNKSILFLSSLGCLAIELGPAVASLMTCGPRTSSPAAVVDGMVSKGQGGF